MCSYENLEHAHRVGPDSHSNYLLAFNQSLKASTAVQVPKTGKGRNEGEAEQIGRQQAHHWQVALTSKKIKGGEEESLDACLANVQTKGGMTHINLNFT